MGLCPSKPEEERRANLLLYYMQDQEGKRETYVYMHIGINIYILNTFPKDGGSRILRGPLVGMTPEGDWSGILATLIKGCRIANCKINLVKTD